MKILIACGTGEVCSTIIRIKVEQLLEGTEYRPEIDQCKVIDADEHMEGVDLFIPAMEIPKTYDVRTIIGQNYLTERDEDELNEKILNAVREIQEEKQR